MNEAPDGWYASGEYRLAGIAGLVMIGG